MYYFAFAAFLPDGEFFASHWNVVLCIGLAFFLLQIVLSVRLYLRMRQQGRILARLCRDYDRGGDGRGRTRSIPKSFAWLRWVLSIFPPNVAAPSGNFNRDDVLKELDTRIASSSDYLLLQRLGVMAPLLGVILTVVGFFWLDVEASDDQSLQGILLSVTPLVLGVGAGAALALVNQALLFGVGGRIEALRMSARTWFDTVIWSNVGLDSQAATAKAIAAVERFTRTVVDSAARHAESTGRVDESTAAMQDAAARFRDVVSSFHGEMKGIPQSLCDLRDATTATADALHELIPVGERAVSNLDVSVAAFRTTIDREFTAAAQLHDSSSKSLSESVRQIRESTESLLRGSDELKQGAQRNAAASEHLDESLRKHLVPGTRRFDESVQALTDQIAVWCDLFSSLSANVESMTVEVSKLAGGLLPSMNSVCDAIDERVGRAVAEHGAHATMVDRSAQQLRETVRQFSNSTTAMNAVLRDTLAGLEEAARSIKNNGRADGDVDRVTETLSRATEVADALSSLHEQIRDVLEQNALDRAALAKPRSGLRAWLPGRPR